MLRLTGPHFPIKFSKRCLSLTLYSPQQTKKVTQQENIQTSIDQSRPAKPQLIPIKDYLALSKSRLSFFVMVTSHAGYCMVITDPSQFIYSQFWIGLSAGTFLTSACANTLNQYIEVDYDSQMARTMNRPLVKNKLSNYAFTPNHALSFAACSGITGTALLYSICGLPAAVLGASNIFLYAGIYTWLKRRHWVNTQIGALVGAIPPLMGSSCHLGWDVFTHPAALSLSAILFFWQIPHFYAIAYNRRNDYIRGGYKMLVQENVRAAQWWSLVCTLALWPTCLVTDYLGYTGHIFLLGSILANLGYTAATIPFFRNMKSKESQNLFRMSLIYILMISGAVFADLSYKRMGGYEDSNLLYRCPVARHTKELENQVDQ